MGKHIMPRIHCLPWMYNIPLHDMPNVLMSNTVLFIMSHTSHVQIFESILSCSMGGRVISLSPAPMCFENALSANLLLCVVYYGCKPATSVLSSTCCTLWWYAIVCHPLGSRGKQLCNIRGAVASRQSPLKVSVRCNSRRDIIRVTKVTLQLPNKLAFICSVQCLLYFCFCTLLVCLIYFFYT